MESKNERLLAGSLAAFSKGKERLFAHIGFWIAVLALLIAALATFTDLSLLSLSAEAMTLKLGIYAVATAVIFLSLAEEGECAGRAESAFTEAQRELKEAVAAVTPHHYGALEDFCRAYTAEELSRRRALLLLTYGARDEAALRPAQLRRYRRLRPLPVRAAMLLGKGADAEGTPLWQPARQRRRRLFARLAPSLLCTAFGIGVAVSVRDSLTTSAVLEGILKLSALLIIGLRGYTQGYLFVSEAEIPFLRAKTRLLAQFLCEHGEEKKESAAS